MHDKHLHTGNALFEAFVEQIKQVLEHLYDFAFLQQHVLARFYDGTSDSSARAAGRQLRFDLINAIESLKPSVDSDFRAPDARLYNILHMIYVESLTIQLAAVELGLSERQAYRDLKRGQESVAAVLWDSHENPSDLPAHTVSVPEFSLQSEMERLRIRFVPVDIAATFQQAHSAVTRLAEQQGIEIIVAADPDEPSLMLSTDPALAHQALVSALSYAIQQAKPGTLTASFTGESESVTLTLTYHARPNPSDLTESAIFKLAGRLQWGVTCEALPEQRGQQLQLAMRSGSKTILVIDDNEGWVSLIERFLEGLNCAVTSMPDAHINLDQIARLAPSALILDVMMPDKDGWEILQRLRAQPTTAQLPIIICTVFNDSQLAFSLGASAFLPKPTDREHLLQTLRTLQVI